MVTVITEVPCCLSIRASETQLIQGVLSGNGGGRAIVAFGPLRNVEEPPDIKQGTRNSLWARVSLEGPLCKSQNRDERNLREIRPRSTMRTGRFAVCRS